MREAVIVSTARTPIGKAYRGMFNDTEAPTLGGLAIAEAVSRAGVDGVQSGGGEEPATRRARDVPAGSSAGSPSGGASGLRDATPRPLAAVPIV